MQTFKGRDTSGYGESAIKLNYPDSYSDYYTLTLLCNGKRLGKITFTNLDDVATIVKVLERGQFAIIPPSLAKKYLKL